MASGCHSGWPKVPWSGQRRVDEKERPAAVVVPDDRVPTYDDEIGLERAYLVALDSHLDISLALRELGDGVFPE
jgi:hypothetical protein